MTLHNFDWFQMKFDMPKRFTAITRGGLELLQIYLRDYAAINQYIWDIHKLNYQRGFRITTKMQNFNFIYLRGYAVINQYIC